MRSLAQFIMRGRTEAIIVALVGGWVIPPLSQAALGLVTLRKGWQEGFIVTLWATLPVLMSMLLSNGTHTLVVASVAAVFVAYLSSIVLRVYVSWIRTFAATILFSSVASILIILFLGDTVFSEIIAVTERMLKASSQTQVNTADIQLVSQSWGHVKVSGLLACGIFLSVITGLLFSRWWQAVLYNEGGFRKEFHALRSSMTLGVLSSVAYVTCLFMGANWQFWAVVAIAPLVIIGLSLVHWLINRYQLGVFPLVILYVGLFVAPLISFLLAVIALSDVWFNYRLRLHLRP